MMMLMFMSVMGGDVAKKRPICMNLLSRNAKASEWLNRERLINGLNLMKDFTMKNVCREHSILKLILRTSICCCCSIEFPLEIV